MTHLFDEVVKQGILLIFDNISSGYLGSTLNISRIQVEVIAFIFLKNVTFFFHYLFLNDKPLYILLKSMRI